MPVTFRPPSTPSTHSSETNLKLSDMKKPTAEKVIIVHRPQKPACTQAATVTSAPVDCGNETVAPDKSEAQAPMQQVKNS